jgi:hypothetical protein
LPALVEDRNRTKEKERHGVALLCSLRSIVSTSVGVNASPAGEQHNQPSAKASPLS